MMIDYYISIGYSNINENGIFYVFLIFQTIILNKRVIEIN